MSQDGKRVPPSVSLARANDTRRRAYSLRAEALFGVRDGIVTVYSVLQAAAAQPASPLLRLRLRQLLLAQRGWTQPKADRVLKHIAQVCGTAWTAQMREVRVSWLLDTRVGGMRYEALVDALVAQERNRPEPPWAGFPFAPVPADLSLDHAGGRR